MGKISINELASVLMERKNLKRKSASAFVNELFYVIQKGLGQDKMVKVKGLGTFKIIDVDDRESVNVNNGERVLIEGHSKITFTPDALMKELVNKPFSQFETVVLNEGVDFEQEPEPEPEPVFEPVPAPDQEPVVVSQPEPMSESEMVDDIDASMAPLVDFVTDNEPQISPEPEPEPEPEPVSEPLEEKLPKEDETPVAEIEAPIAEIEAPEQEIEAPEQEIEAPEQEIEAPHDAVEAPSIEAETPVSEEEPVEESSEEPDYSDEAESSGNWKKWLLGILACCIFFAGGYYVGKTYGGSSPTVEPEVKAAKQKIEGSKPALVKQEAIKPSQEPETAEPEAKSEAKLEAKPESKPEVKPEQKPETKPAAQPEPAVALDKYEQMDSRIRTGAYRIVGTDYVEKVKATDNLARICKRTIGPGMECYLEVYNGIKGDADLKVGQEIKIPKLEHKKKKVKK